MAGARHLTLLWRSVNSGAEREWCEIIIGEVKSFFQYELAHFKQLRRRGLNPALACLGIVSALDKAKEMDRNQFLLLNMCVRGDKDIFSVMETLEEG